MLTTPKPVKARRICAVKEKHLFGIKLSMLITINHKVHSILEPIVSGKGLKTPSPKLLTKFQASSLYL